MVFLLTSIMNKLCVQENVYYFQNQFTKNNKDVLDGHHSQSRFGLAVAAVGDIDYDNYNGEWPGGNRNWKAMDH